MKIFYSGEGSRANPENALLDDAHVMLTYWDMRKGEPTSRFKRIYKTRAKKKKTKRNKKRKSKS